MSTKSPRNPTLPAPRTKGERIRFARLANRISQVELAKQIPLRGGSSITQPQISRWESDDVLDLTNENVFAIEAITGFSARWIITGEGLREVAGYRRSAADPAAHTGISILHRATAATLQAKGADALERAKLQKVIDLVCLALEMRPELDDSFLNWLATQSVTLATPLGAENQRG